MDYDSDYKSDVETRGLNPNKKTFLWYLENSENHEDFQGIVNSASVYVRNVPEISDFVNLRRFRMKELHFSNFLCRKKDVSFDELFDLFLAVHATPMLEVESLKLSIEKIVLGTAEKINEIVAENPNKEHSFHMMFYDIGRFFPNLKKLQIVYYFAVGVISLQRTRLLVRNVIEKLRKMEPKFEIELKFDFFYETNKADKEKDLIQPLKMIRPDEFDFESDQFGGHRATAVVSFENNGFNVSITEVYHLEPL